MAAGAVLRVYSGGLVERCGVVIDDNVGKLCTTVTTQSAESVCVEVMRRMIVLTIPEDEVAVLDARRVVQALPPAPSRRPSPDEQFVDPPRGLPFVRGLASGCHFSRSTTPPPHARPSSAGSDPASGSMSRFVRSRIVLFAR